MTVIAHMETVMIMADRRGHRFVVVMRMAVMVMGGDRGILQGAQVR